MLSQVISPRSQVIAFHIFKKLIVPSFRISEVMTRLKKWETGRLALLNYSSLLLGTCPRREAHAVRSVNSMRVFF